MDLANYIKSMAAIYDVTKVLYGMSARFKWRDFEDNNPAEMSIVQQNERRSSIKARLIYPLCVSRQVFIVSQNKDIIEDYNELNRVIDCLMLLHI